MIEVNIATSYYQFDQQGVAFNMWYLAFMEEARNAYFRSVGYSLERLLADDRDIQLVHVAVDWQAPCRHGDSLVIDTQVNRIGTTSLTFDFCMKVDEKAIATASSVYVIVDRSISGKTSVPEELRHAIGRAQPDGVTKPDSAIPTSAVPSYPSRNQENA